MNRTIHFMYRGRRLEIRPMMTAGDWQVWIYEDGERVYLHNVVPFDPSAGMRGGEALETAMASAKRDVENETIIVPIIRSWPQKRQRGSGDINY
jgi:hypothetical protein